MRMIRDGSRVPALLGYVAAVAVCTTTIAHAQRADTNVITEAEDAFGYAVSGQSLGIYNARSVRGFDPVRLGNVRLDGLYFDRLGDFTSQLIESTFIRVGSTAVNYPFPAPSGVADYSVYGLQKESTSAVTLGVGPLLSPYLEADVGHVLFDHQLSIYGGGSISPDEATAAGGRMNSHSAALSATAQLNTELQVTAFWNRVWDRRLYSDPAVYVTDKIFDAAHIRGDGVGHVWAAGSGYSGNLGTMLNWTLTSDWSLRMGTFYSQRHVDRGYDQVLLVEDSPQFADSWVFAYRNRDAHSYSGEVSLSHTWGDQVVQRVDLSVRGRKLKNNAGSAAEAELGTTSIYRTSNVPVPPLAFSQAADRTRVNQAIAAVRYRSDLYKRATVSTGVQRSSYNIRFDSASGTQSHEQHQDTLFNVALAAPLSSRLAMYSSYTQGLEEGGIAPPDTLNRYQILPVIEVEQIDLGLQYSGSALQIATAVFRLRKPYAGRDANAEYRLIGDVESRGIEASATAHPTDQLTIITGAVLLDASVKQRFANVDTKRRPLGIPNRYYRADVNYALPTGHGLSFDLSCIYQGSTLVNAQHDVALSSATTLDIGARLPFEWMTLPATLRVQVQNVTNELSWGADVDGALLFQNPRTFSVALTMSTH